MPVFEVEMNGKTYEVEAPDQATALSALGIGAPSAPAEAAPDESGKPVVHRGPIGRFNQAFKGGVTQGLTANFGNEILSGAMTPIELGIGAYTGEDSGKGLMARVMDAYGRAYGKGKVEEKQAYDANPAANIAGNVTGGLITAGKMAQGGLSLLNGAKPTIGSMALRGAGEGAAYGAVYGAGAGEGLEDRARGAAVGAGVGGLTGGATGAIGGMVAKRTGNKTIDTIEQLRQKKNNAYVAVDAIGHRYPQADFDGLANTIAGRAQAEKINPMRHPKAASMVDDILQMKGQSPTLTELDQLRQVVSRDVASATDPAERRLGSIIIDEIDRFIAAPTSNQQASAAIKTARELNTRLSKAEKLGLAVTKAERRAASTGSGGNVENAIRQNIRSILDDPKKLRGFTKDEIEAMEKVVRGGPVQNLLRLAGKLSPSGNGLMAALGIGGTLVNPLAAAVPAAGFAAKAASEGLQSAQVNALGKLVRSGGQMPMPQLTATQKFLIDATTRATGQQAYRAGTNR